jgi:2-polyprenyl-3-methyl-5-hydroxy-6-metoxy-1,4-benzoquinol methylase
LDVGCGEGYACAFFKERGFNVLGLDYSSAGIKNHNNRLLDNAIIGDVYDSLKDLIGKSEKFDIINMDNVLEHVINPKFLLEQIYILLNDDGIVIIKVPNDFSLLQQHFIEKHIVIKPHWVAPLDHISYFNRAGLIKICDTVGFENIDILGNYMTEFFILNPNTNYLENESVGKSCHLARVAQENIFHEISPELTIELYRTLGKMGLGREIIGVFKKQRH